MISVDQAINIILEKPIQLSDTLLDLRSTAGRVLAAPVFADRDLPPFDRVAMDGIALRHEDFATGTRIFSIVGIQYAGDLPLAVSGRGSCIEIMTGAALPPHFDTVIRYEDVDLDKTTLTAEITVNEVTKGQNIQPQGNEKKQGEQLLSADQMIGPAEMAVLASVGMHKVRVKASPTVAIIATGDELVGVSEMPLPHQIRMSNTYAIAAALKQRQIPSEFFHLRDEKSVLQSKLQTILKNFQVVILSGGVSAGKADHVPQVLEALGVEKHFHKIAQKPGKPFWFGTKASENYVFAFPGNPVSTFLCYYRYFEPWLNNCLLFNSPPLYAQLDADFTFKPSLTYFLQVCLYQSNASLMASPTVGLGSGDFANLAQSHAFMELPAEKEQFMRGETYRIWPFRQL